MSAGLSRLFYLDTERRRLRQLRLKGQATPPHQQREDEITDQLLTGLLEVLRTVGQDAQQAMTRARRPY